MPDQLESGGIPPTPSATAGAPASSDVGTIALAKDVIGVAAPWKAGMAWWVVVAEGAALAAVGGLLLLAPGFSANSILLLLGAVVLVTAAITAVRLLRHRVPPDRVAISAFRSGAGVAIGLAIVVGGLLIGEGDEAETVAISMLLGVGLLVFGIAGLVGALTGGRGEGGLPVAALILSGGMTAVGAWLLFGAYAGYEQLKGSFQWLGLLLVLIGGALLVWGYVLRGRQTAEVDG